MPIGPPAPVAAPAPRQPTTGLIAEATRLPTPTGWQGQQLGYEYETCDPAVTLPVDCGETPEKAVPDHPDAVVADPVRILGADSCTTTMHGIDAAAGERATRHLEATQSAALEFTAWTGEATSDDVAEGADRPHFASADTTVLAGGTAVSPIHALALVDQALTVCLSNGKGMVHVTPYTLARLHQLGAIVRENGRWITPNGHSVIAGAGYTGGGPRPAAENPLPAPPDLLATAPADQWMYGTGMVSVALGPIDDDTAPINVATNSYVASRERAAAALWGCCTVAALLDLALT